MAPFMHEDHQIEDNDDLKQDDDEIEDFAESAER
jgi:hypothetical protein